MPDSSLKKDDLNTMMEAYRNMVESNMQVMTKQDAILDEIKGSCVNMNSVFNQVLQGITQLNDTMLLVNENLGKELEVMIRVENNLLAVEETVKSSEGKALERFHSIKDLINTAQYKNLKVYALISLLITAIMGLAGFLYKLVMTPKP